MNVEYPFGVHPYLVGGRADVVSPLGVFVGEGYNLCLTFLCYLETNESVAYLLQGGVVSLYDTCLNVYACNIGASCCLVDCFDDAGNALATGAKSNDVVDGVLLCVFYNLSGEVYV